MSKFDEREKSFEKKFAKDQELQFKVSARSNKYLAEWVSLKLGKNDEQKQNYVQEVIKSDLQESGHEDVFRKDKKDARTEFDINYAKTIAGPYIAYEGLYGE